MSTNGSGSLLLGQSSCSVDARSPADPKGTVPWSSVTEVSRSPSCQSESQPPTESWLGVPCPRASSRPS
eukprot:11116677-Karenia_brevis.AAC.1